MPAPKVILVVDDEHFILECLCEQLGLLGYSTRAAADGEAAIQLLRAEEPDAVLLDLNMPKVDGEGVLRYLRESGRKTKVIVTSAFIDDARLAQLAPYLPDAIVNKPWKWDALIAAIERLTGAPPEPSR